MDILHIIKYRKTEIIVLAILVFEFAFPHYGIAAVMPEAESILLPNMVIKANSEHEIKAGQMSLEFKTVKVYQVNKTYKIPITAYSSTVDQCDDTPCITASGFNLCQHNQEDIIAANFLPLGTKVRIPELYGDRVFTVEDRMNARSYYRADIWMKTRASAQKFGLAYATLEVLE